MKLTVAICTWNRSAILQQTLEQLTKLYHPPDGFQWELLVVNNRCTDATDAVIAAYGDKLPLTRLYEEKPGLSNDRNRAVEEATGDYIIWTDDDVLVDSNWLIAYAEAFTRWPEASFFGGPVRPWFEKEPPAWLMSFWNIVTHAYAIRDLGSNVFAFCIDGEMPFGANYAVRRDVQLANRYNPNFGLNQGKIVLGEETRMMRDIISRGGSGLWIPQAGVSHLIASERLSIDYLRKYYVGQGRTLRRAVCPADVESIFVRPLWFWRKCIAAELRYRYRRFVATPDIWIHDFINASNLWGQLFTD